MLFQCRSCLQAVVAAFLEVWYLQYVIPPLNHSTFPLLSHSAQDPCTIQRASGRAGVDPRPPALVVPRLTLGEYLQCAAEPHSSKCGL